MARQGRSLAGKVVVITGGGRGIGAATANLIAKEGAFVAIGDLDEQLAKETAASVRGTAVGMALDVTDHAGFTALLDRVERELGPIDVLVNNAGIMPLNRIEDEPASSTNAQFAVNVLAVIHGTKEAVRRMKPRGGGHIVNVSSAAGRVPVAGGATYTATKHAVSGFSNALHIEFKADESPIHVTAVHPAIVRTELSKGLKDNKGVSPVTPEQVAAAIVDALRNPRPNVYVPKSLDAATKLTCDVPMVVSHYLKRAPKLLKPVKRGGPVPVITTSTEIRQPKGVVGIIAPWNFPFATGLSDAVPALMAGNGIVLKPDNKTALSPLYGVSLLYEAGLPRGLFQVVCGESPVAGPPVIDNANFVMFTGSTQTGRFIGQRAGENLIGCTLELGGKNPMLVLEDTNLDESMPAIIEGVFRNTSQVCMHIERIYVHERMFEEFTRRFLEATKQIKLGASYDYGPEMGSLISVDHKDRVASHVEDARARGATVLTGGRARPDLGPAFYEPTVLTGVTKDMPPGAVRPSVRSSRCTRTAPCPRRSAWPTTPTTASTRACSAATSPGRRRSHFSCRRGTST